MEFKRALTKGVASLDFQGRPAQEIKFYPIHIFPRKMSFFVYDLDFQVRPLVSLMTPLVSIKVGLTHDKT